MRGTRRGVGGHGRMTQTRNVPSHGCTWSGPTPQEQPNRWTQSVEQKALDQMTQLSHQIWFWVLMLMKLTVVLQMMCLSVMGNKQCGGVLD
ncbi:hypothetical protein CIPAW_05G160500 [Carya illinoinensis]|uniref:Uncharacterized protein n=1 Tax=Carya illinoinensis TaxID=32201 RepID=A0A8T1QJ21_CARIL|nr:hypothetical protein CIPAW_05G160500 [Carya illinoinensis]